MSGLAPLSRTYTAVLPATGATADFNAVVCEAPFAGTLTRAAYVPDTAITGADTNSRTINIHNRKQDGSGGTDVVMATLEYESGTNGVAYDANELTLSVVANATTVAEGDVLTAESLHIGASGLADPGGTIIIELTRA